MEFELTEAIKILERTPATLRSLLIGVPEDWLTANEGPGTWNAREILSHLIYLDHANWIHRATLLLTTKTMVSFDPINREGGHQISTEMDIKGLVELFAATRTDAISKLRSLGIHADQYSITALHPDFGEVKLSQLLAAWVVHDLNHIAQVTRVIAKQYKDEVGPWAAYLRILN